MTVYANSKVLSSSYSRFAGDATVSWPKEYLKPFRSCGPDGFSLGSRGSGVGSGQKLHLLCKALGSCVLARTGAWYASPDVSKIIWRVTFLYMDSDMSMSSVLLSWLPSISWRKCTVYVGAHQDLLHANAGIDNLSMCCIHDVKFGPLHTLFE